MTAPTQLSLGFQTLEQVELFEELSLDSLVPKVFEVLPKESLHVFQNPERVHFSQQLLVNQDL